MKKKIIFFADGGYDSAKIRKKLKKLKLIHIIPTNKRNTKDIHLTNEVKLTKTEPQL